MVESPPPNFVSFGCRKSTTSKTLCASFTNTGRHTGPSAPSIDLPAELFAGGMAGVAMWSIAIPPDVVKSRMQAAPAGTYKGFNDCVMQIIRQEGPKALFKGLGPALLRAFPANAVAFLGRAATLRLLHEAW